MPRVKIIPNATYHPGHVGNLINLIAPGPMIVNPDGTVVAKLTAPQLEEFNRRGGAPHKIEILPDVEPATSTTVEVRPAVVEGVYADPEASRPAMSPSLVEYLEACRNRGMDDNQIIAALVKSGWKESQAIDAVMNDIPLAA